MSIKVVKFGGTSVADAAQIRKTGDIVRADDARRYVVVSAPGKRFDADNKITDLLYLVKTQLDQNAPYGQVLDVIRERFTGLERDLGIDVDAKKQIDEIEDALKQGASGDYAASRGEFLCAQITAAYLGYDFVDTATLVMFDENGKFLSDATNEAMRTELSEHERAVLPGFYGSMPDGRIHTFTRGGSDITGALVARAMKADVYENWTDVSGFLMADPRIVDNPKNIDTISYMELRELSYMGASVMHENAIYPVRQAGIPINIRNVNKPEDPGTLIIAEEQERGDDIITGIAGSKGYTVIAIYKNMMSIEVGFIKRVLNILEDYNVSIEHIPTGIDTVSVVIDSAQLAGKLGDILDDIERKTGADRVEAFEDIALIATVGGRMASHLGVSAKLFTALSEAGVNVRMIDQGSSEMNIIIGVKNDDFEIAVRAIYNAFVGEGESWVS